MVREAFNISENKTRLHIKNQWRIDTLIQ